MYRSTNQLGFRIERRDDGQWIVVWQDNKGRDLPNPRQATGHAVVCAETRAEGVTYGISKRGYGSSMEITTSLGRSGK